MWWGKSSDETPRADATSADPKPKDGAAAASRSVAGKDADKVPKRERLPPKLQELVDKSDQDDNFFDELVDGYAPPSTESNVRYAGYAARARTILLSAHRYVAYTSDIGESFRPVAHPWLIRGAYGISWAYIAGDVGYEGYKAHLANQGARHAVAPLDDYRTVMAQRLLFQSLASMGLPAFTIHSVVRYSGRALKNNASKTVRTWAPIGLGLAVVPMLPTLFDKPVENGVEWVFHKGFEAYGGKEAVGEAPLIGREKQLHRKEKKEKEL